MGDTVGGHGMAAHKHIYARSAHMIVRRTNVKEDFTPLSGCSVAW
jgi:hypothetical protein